MNERVQTSTTEPLFNPLAPEFIRDPYPAYERLRTTDPMHVTPFGSFLASRHAEASLVLRDKRFGKDFVNRSIRRYGDRIMDEPVFRSMSHWMLQQDPPDHTRLRGLVVKAFTARRVEDMRPRIQEIVDQTLDAVEGRGHMDLIADFAYRLPVTIICDMLGIPEEHREIFHQRSGDGGRLLDPVPLTPAEIAARQRRQHDGAALFPAAVRTAAEKSRRRPDHAAGAGRGGRQQAHQRGADRQHHPVVRRRPRDHGQSDRQWLLALHRNPDQLALLKARPDLITNAVEEFLRYDSSVQMTGRVALEDIDDLGGTKIPKGETVLCLLGSANRDPAVYPDRPDSLDITRPNVKPLSFGGGIHHCLGAQLARIEAEIAILHAVAPFARSAAR